MTVKEWNGGFPENPRWCAECMFAARFDGNEPHFCRLKYVKMQAPAYPLGNDATWKIKEKCAARMIMPQQKDGIEVVQRNHRCESFVADGLRCKAKDFGATFHPSGFCNFTCMDEYECPRFVDGMIKKLPERRALENKEKVQKSTKTLDTWLRR